MASGPSPFEATGQPSNGRDRQTEDLRPHPLTGVDALLDVTLSSTTLVHTLLLTWEYPARDVLVLYSAEASGDSWELGGASNTTTATRRRLR